MPVSTKPAKSQDGITQPQSPGSQSRGIIPAPERFEAYAKAFQKAGQPDKAEKAESMARQLRRFTPKAADQSSSPEPKASHSS